MKENTKIRYGLLVILIVFFSGFASLTYQVIWERTLKYCFGGDVISASIIVSVFLLGLGIGAFLFRKIKEKALIALALVELFIGLFGMWSYEIILQTNQFIIFLISKLGLGQESEAFAVFLGTFIFLLIPTVLMGGTLPLMFESFIPKIEKNTKFIGFIYGMNTLGAFLGAIVPPLVFGTLGLPNTVKLTSALSICISLVLFGLVLSNYKLAARLDYQETPVAEVPSIRKNVLMFITGFSFMTGFIALALEILFIRFIGIMHGSTSYSFPIIISTYLFSIAVGSMFWSFLRDRIEVKKSKILPFMLQTSVGVIVPLTMILFQFVLNSKYSDSFNFRQMFTTATGLLEKGQFLLFAKNIFIFSLPLLILVLPVVFFSSGVFPTLIKNLSEFKISLGKSTGIIYFSNSVGCMSGSLITGFLAIPLAGWYPTLILISILSILIGASGLMYMGFSLERVPKKPFILGYKSRFFPIIFIVLPLILFLVSDKRIKYKVATGEYSPQSSFAAYKEGVTGVVAITKEKKGKKTLLHVYSNGQYMSALPDHPRHVYLANLPRIQPKLKSVMLLGLGGGRSLADLLTDDRVKNVVAVDWSREIVKVVGSAPIARFNKNPLADSRVKVEMSDARKVVSNYANRNIKFDAIIDNLCFAHWPGAGGVKSIQFFKRIKAILKPDGFYYHINNFHQEKNLILFTLAEVFDYVVIHNGMMVICGDRLYSPPESQVVAILNEKRLLRRAPDLFIPKSVSSEDFYSTFKKLIIKVKKDELGQVRPLTDEIPSTEYFITLPFLMDKIKAGLR